MYAGDKLILLHLDNSCLRELYQNIYQADALKIVLFLAVRKRVF